MSLWILEGDVLDLWCNETFSTSEAERSESSLRFY